jgi:purine-binding chemotaxis protein CheW
MRTTLTRGQAADVGVAALPGEYLTFRLGSEHYGVDILQVQEIRSNESCTRIVDAPAHVRGVINLRGVIVPVVDLRMKFDREPQGDESTAVTIVVNVGGRTVGMVVDAVNDVADLTAQQMLPAPQFADAIDTRSIRGLASVHVGDTARTLILLDIDRLLPEVAVNPASGALH